MKKLLNASEKTAIASSFVCVLHCMALPLILIVLPSVSGLLVFSDERFHLWLVIAVAPISIFAITTDYFHRRRTSVFYQRYWHADTVECRYIWTRHVW